MKKIDLIKNVLLCLLLINVIFECATLVESYTPYIEIHILNALRLIIFNAALFGLIICGCNIAKYVIERNTKKSEKQTLLQNE